MAIPEGYARVMVDRVENGWEDLDLEIPGGYGEEEFGQALHTWICWKKQYIRITGKDPSPSPRSTPAAQGSLRPSVDPPSLAVAQDPSVSPSSSPAASGEPSVSPPSPSPPPAMKKKSAWAPPPPPPRPKKTQERKKKEKPAPEKSGYEMTPEELTAWGARRRAQAVEAKEASAKGTSGSSSEEILSIHDVPTKASTDVRL